MAHFAKLDENNIVLQVIVVSNDELIDENNGTESEQKGINFLIDWSGGYTKWKQTSYNAKFRKNYAGIGYTYDETRDAFIPPKPWNSWLLDEETCTWISPVSMPNIEDGKRYKWNEETISWDEI